MSFAKFLFGMGKQKTKELGDSVTAAIVSWDPMAASEVQIEEMQSRFVTLSEKVEVARQDWQREQHEADVMQANFDKKKKAATLLQGDLTDTAETNRAAIEASLDRLLDDLEEMKPDLETEIEEAVEAKKWLDTLEGDLTLLAEKLKTARKNLTKAAKNMEKAQHREEQAQERAREAEERAGIRKTTDALDNVLNVMNDNVKKAEAKAAAADKRSRLLETKSLEGDALVASALSRASGVSTEKRSAADRLASL